MRAGLNSGIDWAMENKCAVLPEANKPTTHPAEREREREKKKTKNQNNEQRQNNAG